MPHNLADTYRTVCRHLVELARRSAELVEECQAFIDVESAVTLHAGADFSQEDRRALSDKYPELMSRFQTHQAAMMEVGLTESARNERHKAFIIQDWFPLLFADRQRGKEILEALYPGVGFSFRHTAYIMTVDAKNLDARPLLGKIRCRMLLIAGANDMLPSDRIAEAHRSIAGSRFEIFDKSAHFAPLEEPEWFRSVLLDFIQLPSR